MRRRSTTSPTICSESWESQRFSETRAPRSRRSCRTSPKTSPTCWRLQEASALAMADGFAQSTGKPALVNLHTAAGTGNAMGSLVAAYRANTPLIVTAGQQTREMSIIDPYLNNPDATEFPKPWVKWSYEPARAEDVPAAFMQAYAVAMQEPKGPVFLSIPLDDWQKPALGPAVVRTVSERTAPDGRAAPRVRRPDQPGAAAAAGARARGRPGRRLGRGHRLRREAGGTRPRQRPGRSGLVPRGSPAVRRARCR